MTYQNITIIIISEIIEKLLNPSKKTSTKTNNIIVQRILSYLREIQQLFKLTSSGGHSATTHNSFYVSSVVSGVTASLVKCRYTDIM